MSGDQGYYHVAGVFVPETPPSQGDATPWSETRVVGKRRPRVDAYERVSGTAVYPSDVVLPDMLYGAILRCPHPHAVVRKVDTSRAEAMPGVRAILTADTPGADVDYTGYRQGVTDKLFPKRCRFEGEAVAAVAAETPYQARDALRAIEVDYAKQSFVSEYRDALDRRAPKVHRDGNRVGEPAKYTRGDVDRGFDEADAVVERTYSTACEIHTPLELHGCVARWDGGALNVWESTQGVYRVQQDLSEMLGLPLADVRVMGHYMGGGFGSKLWAGKYTPIAALLAKQAARPVKLFLSREETCLTAGNRPPSRMTVKAGVKKDGTLTAIRFEGLGTGGAFPSGGTSLLEWLAKDLYVCPNVETETTDVFIHAGPARPFRAPGHPQGAWALEQVMDELAEAIGMDPVALRLKNIPTVSQARPGQPPYTTTGLKECLERGATAFRWKEAREEDRAEGHLKRGVGVAAAEWIAGSGGPPSTVVVKLFSDGSANLNMGASDIGTGTKTVMAMVVAEELGVPVERIRVENADTGTTQYATPSGGSKTVPTEAPAVRHAALQVKAQILEMAAEHLDVDADDLELRDGVVAGPGSERVEVTKLEGLNKRGLVVGVGYRGPNPEGKVVSPFAAQFCEVEVNTRTGEVRLLRFLGAHESGRVMNRKTFDNQAFGGIVMGIGLGLTEERILDHGQTGRMVNTAWHDYKVPTMQDTPPEMTSVAIDMPDPEANDSGAKGLGEPVTIPTAAAIANAVYDATGVRVTETPVHPARMKALLAERTEEGE
ncbi:MAG: xanthine dehydrogenase family protein molybdopterin-binding subunit [Myxococcota bacterium]